MKNKYLLIDPCYLKHKDSEWDMYCKSMKNKWNLSDKKIITVFDNTQGIYIDNGYGDIDPNSFEIDLEGERIRVPACDAGHHIIFNYKDVENRIDEKIGNNFYPISDFMTIFESEYEFEELTDVIELINLEHEKEEKYR